MVLEGLRSKALYRLMTEELPRDRPNQQKYTVLYNSEVHNSQRVPNGAHPLPIVLFR